MENVFINMMYVLFPILLYFVIYAYNKNLNKHHNKIIYDLFLMFSFSLSISLCKDIYSYSYYYIIYIPLLLSYLKKRNMLSIIMSIITIVYLINNTEYNYLLVISNYLLLFLMYKFIKKYYIYFYIVVNSIYILLYNNYNIDYIFVIFAYVLSSFIVLFLFDYIERIMKFYMTSKEINNNKQLQGSLFKISHEIKNPIAVCRGYLELMDGSLELYNKYIPIISNEINHSLSILKDFSSIGKLKIELDIMDIGLLISEVINDYRVILDDKKISFDYINDYDELIIMGDYIRLKEVFINCIKNSIEALDNSNNPFIKIIVEQKNNKIFIRIRDNGCGVSEEELGKISEPFFTTKKDGTGLGTYLSKEIMDNHNASIDYYSRKNYGMEVVLKFDNYTI